MKIAIVGAETDLGMLVVDRLEGRHELHLYARGGADSGGGASDTTLPEGVESLDLRDEPDAGRCARGVNAIVHLGPFAGTTDPPVDDQVAVDVIDAAARGTYNLFYAAREAGVDRVVFASSLSFFDSYDPDYLIDEYWKPLPSTDPRQLALSSAEEVSRQFCLHGGIRCVTLRLLPLGDDEATHTAPSHAVAAVERALELRFTVPGYRWHVFHIATSPRFITRNARETLGWEAHHG